MKEKSVIIVLDEDKYLNQKEMFYNSRKTLIHVYNGDKIEELKRYKKALKEIVKWNEPVVQDYHSYSIAKDALSKWNADFILSLALKTRAWASIRENGGV